MVGPTRKKTNVVLSLQQRYSILLDLNNGAKQVDLAKKYNVDGATISRIRKNSADIEARIQSGSINIGMKRLKTTLLDDVDKALLQWFTNEGHGLPGLSGLMLQEKAKLFGLQLELPPESIEKIDINWINRWKNRHAVVSKTLHGESNSVNDEVVSEWTNSIMPTITREFSPENVYNVDEMGLFWKLLPNKTLEFKTQKCSGGKRAKERITVLVGANGNGERLPLLIIGKSKTPRCFRGKKNAR